MTRIHIIPIAILWSGVSAFAQGAAYTVQNFAGSSVPVGDGGPASSAILEFPSAITFDAAGSLYIADSYNGRVRKVTGGVISTIAGNGTFGYTGDGGPAIQAQLSIYTSGIAVDPAGNVYVSDSGNAAVRKIATDGTISTIMSGATVTTPNGFPFYPGNLATDKGGNLYVLDVTNPQLWKLAPDGSLNRIAGTGRPGVDGDNGAATFASLSYPGGILVDSDGTIYLADFDANRIRKITPDGIIHAFAGTGELGYSGDGGPALSAQFFLPWAIGKDNAGNFYVLESGAERVRKIAADGTITTVVGADNFDNLSAGDGGPAIQALLNTPQDMAFSPSGDMYIADLDCQIRVVTADGMIRAAIGARHLIGDGGPAAQAAFAEPSGVAVDNAGNLFVAEQNNFRVRKIDSQGIVTTIAGTGEYGFSGDGGSATAAKLTGPLSVATDGAGNVYVGVSDRVRRITTAGVISTVAGGGFSQADKIQATTAALAQPSGIVVDPSGNLFISDTNHGRIVKVTPAGVLNVIAGNGLYSDGGDNGPATGVALVGPCNLALDAKGNLYVTDSAHARIRVITPDGTIKAFAGTGKVGDDGDGGAAVAARLTNPVSVTVDGAGVVYIADEGAKKVRMVTPDGLIQTIATGKDLDAVPDFIPNGGFAHYSQQYDYLFVAADPSGRVYVADQYRDRIQVLVPKQ